MKKLTIRLDDDQYNRFSEIRDKFKWSDNDTFKYILEKFFEYNEKSENKSIEELTKLFTEQLKMLKELNNKIP